MLFHKRTQKIMKVVWWVLSILIIISMILLYAPIFSAPTTQTPPTSPYPEQN